jgi:hypothetical protein
MLTFVVVASLIVNALLGGRLRTQRSDLDRLRATVSNQQKELSDLRARIRGTGAGDPLAQIAGAVARLRGLGFKRTVTPELLSLAGLRARIRGEFLQDNNRASLEATGQVLHVLGLVPAGFDLFKTSQALQEEQVAGYYDQSTKRLVVGATDAKNPSPFTRIILAHEYTHAVTDQHFGLGRLKQLQKNGQDDQAEAFLCLAEGDATLLMRLYTQNVLTSDEQAQAQQEALNVPTARFDAVPAFLQDVLQFPYVQGLDFVTTLHDRGGFDLVDQAYKDPPTSTEQIMHPERYTEQRDAPTPVTLPNVRATMGTGWSVLETGGIGELDVLEILDRGGGNGLPVNEARDAAKGWDGGRYVALRSRRSVLFAAPTVWDSDSEAREAATAFLRWLRVRFPNATRFDAGSGEGWASGSGAGAVMRNGNRMLLVLGPDRSSVQRARGAFRGF